MDAFSNYIREQMKSKVLEFHALSDLNVDVSLVQCKNIQTKHQLISFTGLTNR